jgi:hypothetical protein
MTHFSRAFFLACREVISSLLLLFSYDSRCTTRGLQHSYRVCAAIIVSDARTSTFLSLYSQRKNSTIDEGASHTSRYDREEKRGDITTEPLANKLARIA